VLVHEVDDRMGTRGISVQRLNETHAIGQPILLNTSYIDREPFLAYHPPSNDFLLVWDWDQNNDNVPPPHPSARVSCVRVSCVSCVRVSRGDGPLAHRCGN
jgi:hypothetical protein